jgi:dienelactone hydrolase
MKKIVHYLLLLFFVVSAGAEIMTKEIIYKQDTTSLKGLLIYDNAIKERRPGILVVHEWWGLNEFTKTQATKLAKMGYIAFAADMYGNGVSTTDPKVAATMAGQLRGTPLLRSRVVAAYKTLCKQDFVDTSRIAAIGFCFGGTSVLELAYSGANLKGVVTFHGGLFSPKGEELYKSKTKFLILHGADDPTMSPEVVSQFQESMRKAGVDWQMVSYGNAVHAFTNPAAGDDKSKGVAYNPLAAERSWRLMKDFFGEILTPEKSKQ